MSEVRSVFLLLAMLGCEAARSNNTVDQGSLQFGDMGGDDLAMSLADLAGADLAGVDLTPPPGSDLLMPDLAQQEPDLKLPPPDGSGTITQADTCGTAPTLTAGLVYDDQDTTGLTDDYHIGQLSGGNCNTNNNVYKEPDAAYQISVPAGKTLTVKLTPHNLPTVWDPALAIVEDCSNGATCLAGHDDSNLTGNDEVVSWTNSSGATKNVFVIVDAYGHSGTLNYGYGKYSILAIVN